MRFPPTSSRSLLSCGPSAPQATAYEATADRYWASMPRWMKAIRTFTLLGLWAAGAALLAIFVALVVGGSSWIEVLVDPVSLAVYVTVAGGALLLWSLGSLQDGRTVLGAVGIVIAVGLILVAVTVAATPLTPPFCPVGQHLRGAAGRILWCAPVRER